jgi:hypothetical protein
MKKRANANPKCGHFNLVPGCIPCRELFAKWNKVLENEDDEVSDRYEKRRLKTKEVKKDRKISSCIDSTIHEAIRDYYLRLEQAFNAEAFTNKTHKEIMWHRANGARICEIQRALRRKRVKIHRETIRHVIRRYETKWKIKKWTLRQMNMKAPIAS